MGEHNVEEGFDQQKVQVFMSAVLEDLRALAFMLAEGLVEDGIFRIGAEQEMFLIDREYGPAPLSLEVLDHINDPRLTTEIARFNLEANLTPLMLTGDCLSRMERELDEVIAIARESAAREQADILLSGILPTLQKTDLTLANLTPTPRYRELDSAVIRLRGGPFEIHIKGLDEIQIKHENIMMESCNTSFQIHFQTSPGRFVEDYNLAQAITAPVLAVAVNSPLLFGLRLWQETRVALFQHSADARSQVQLVRRAPPRVTFGDQWLHNSIVDLFHDQITRFRPIMISSPDENPFEVLARGETPTLSALRMHNGTVWRWNRACYGVENGKAHLRIENRALPAGPTIADEMANLTFFVGLMLALPQEYGDIAQRLSFEDAKSNFFRAARHGLDAQFNWIDGQSHSASTLVLDHLLPLAHEGLVGARVSGQDIDRYLGIVKERVRTRQTGSRWLLKSIAAMPASACNDVRQRRLTSVMLTHQKRGHPVHKWPVVEAEGHDDWEQSYRTVGQFMTTDLFTVQPDDRIDLAASVMDWRHIRHVPVEDGTGRLVGLLSHRALLHLLTKIPQQSELRAITVKEIMVSDPVTISPSTPTLDAIEIMRQNGIGCLPVVEGDQLVGIVTSYDFLEASSRLFQQHLASKNEPAKAMGRAVGQ